MDITCVPSSDFRDSLQSSENVGPCSTRGVHPGGGGDHPPAEPEHGHSEVHFHASEVRQEHSEDHPIHEDGVRRQVRTSFISFFENGTLVFFMKQKRNV